MNARRIITVGFLGALLLAGTADARGAGDGAAGKPDQAEPAGLRSVELSGPAGAGTDITGLALADGSRIALASPLPLFSLLVDGKPSLAAGLPIGLTVSVAPEDGFKPGAKLNVVFRNDTKSKITLESLVPLGQGADRVYITAGLPNEEPHTLDRTQLFRPGLAPVGVVVPDNAWSMGFSSVEAGGGTSVTALARRVRTDKAERTRWAATLAPGGSVEYALYFEAHRGGWRRGLEIMFRERYLYDLDKFDDTMFRRADLAWVRHAYLMVLQFAWDRT
ncbi:MAG: yfmG, partial [Candidatus Aminicenantes bacterium]|nr:yfmG [Candidatus Aminicenantes bacterium]